MFGICNLAIIPLRIEPNDRSEIVSQVLFGEHFEVIEQQKQWTKVRLQYDSYEGWVDTKQITATTSQELNNRIITVLNRPYQSAVLQHGEILLTIGSEVSENFGSAPQTDIASTALQFLN